jgi:aspartyl-tRNA(Asn)/glutamyl-tRNA(Gln) amidotransferase subunit B
VQIPGTLAEALEIFEPVIGLEVHAQLKTASKIFSNAAASFDLEHPNTNIDAYSIGLPGVLPVLNRRVVEMAIRTGLALGCEIRRRSVFSRKHYFYPDLPKGYQISQYDLPICEHGHLEVGDKKIRIRRIHLEEDAGKNSHLEDAPLTLLDFNRAGVPLIEIVSDPDLGSAAEAGQYLRALRAILMTLGVCDGNMQEGSFRADINVSLRPRGTTPLGTRVEVKNVNSFRFVEQAIEVEIVRQARAIAEGTAIVQETRLYDSQKKATRSMRSKEEAHDYRYFPDPDLPPLLIEEPMIAAERASLPELPAAKRARWLGLGLSAEVAGTFAEERDLGAYFDAAAQKRPELAVPIANFIKGEVLRELKEESAGIQASKLSPETLAELVALKESDKISSSQQKKLFAELWRSGASLESLASKEGEQVSDEAALAPLIDEVMTAHAGEVEKLKQGKTQIMSFLVGQVMKRSGGKAKPAAVKALFEARLKS